jgi:glycosyltransferase involved in cell wall biosynthesis
MNNNNRRLKIALMVNIVAPSRVALYSGLAEHSDLLLLHGGTESNRASWDNLGRLIPNANVIRAWGFQIRKQQKNKGKVYNCQFFHITPGFIWHLLRFWPDAVISNEMGLRTIVALLYGIIARRPVWVWWGGTVHTERNIGKMRRALRFLISHWGNNWISYGQTSTEYLMTLGIRRDRILEAQNCVDERRFSEAAQRAFQLEPRPVLLHVGQFIGRKGIDLLLKAAATLQQEGHEFSLLLVGSGRDKQELESLAKDLLLQNVRFENVNDPLEMSGIYRSADVLIFPTLEDVWGLVANEAMWCGVPVLCSKYAGCAPELFTAESVFDPQDADEFVRRLGEALAGHLPKSDRNRLKTTQEIVSRIVLGVEASVDKRAESIRSTPMHRSS